MGKIMGGSKVGGVTKSTHEETRETEDRLPIKTRAWGVQSDFQTQEKASTDFASTDFAVISGYRHPRYPDIILLRDVESGKRARYRANGI